jgi:hypothetical protein
MSSGNSTAGTTVSGITTDTRSAASARDRGQGRGHGRGARSGGRSNNWPRATGFKGSTLEMNGHVFECYREQTDTRQYAKKTVEALENYSKKKTFKFSKDLVPLFATESRLPVIATPPKPTRTADGKEPDDAYIVEVKELAKRKRALQSNLAVIQAIMP